MSLILTGNTSNITIDSTSGITFPNNTIQSVAAQTGPAFSAYSSSGTVTSTGANTKINFQAEEYDTNNNFASSRFTPTVAGYYQFNAAVYWGTPVSTRNVIYVFKNGASTTTGFGTDFNSSNNYVSILSLMLYANGTTDYFEVYVYQQSGGNITTGNPSYFQGYLARAA